MAHDIFISHSHEDKLVADAACAVLEKHGVRCWIAPRDVTPGIDYADQISQAIEDCRALIIVFSTHTNASRHVKAEIDSAFAHNKILMPLRIEAIEPAKGMAHYLRNVHWLDAYTPPMEDHLEHLAETLLRMLPDRSGIPAGPRAVTPKAPAAPSPAAPTSPPERDAISRKGPRPVPPRQLAPRQPNRRGPALIVGLVVLALAAGVVYFRGRSPAAAGPPPTPNKVAPAPNLLAGAKVAYAAGNFADAVRQCDGVIAANPASAPVYALRGAALTGLDDYDGAIADCTKAIGLDPQYAPAYANRADAEAQKVDLTPAWADCQKAIQLDAGCSAAFAARGFVEMLNDRDEVSLADCTQAIALDAGNVRAYYYRALVSTDGLADINEAIRRNPATPYYYTERGSLRNKSGNLLASNPQADLDHAIDLLDQIIAANPKAAEACYYRGEAKDAKDDHRGALLDFYQAISLNPTASYYYSSRAVTEQNNKDFTAALADADQAIALNPGFEGYYSERADIKDAKGDKEGAQADRVRAADLKGAFGEDPQLNLVTTVPEAIRLLTARNYTDFLKQFVPPEQAAQLNSQITNTFIGLAPLLLGALQTVKDQTPEMNSDGTHATFKLDHPVADMPEISFIKVKDRWYLE